MEIPKFLVPTGPTENFVTKFSQTLWLFSLPTNWDWNKQVTHSMGRKGWESIAIDGSEIQRSTWDTVDGSGIPNNHRLDGAKTP